MIESESELAKRVLKQWREQAQREEEEAYTLGQQLFDKLDSKQDGFIGFVRWSPSFCRRRSRTA